MSPKRPSRHSPREKERTIHRPTGRTQDPRAESESKRRATSLFDAPRLQVFFTNMGAEAVNAVVTDKIHSRHAGIWQVNADPKTAPWCTCCQVISGANRAWLSIADMASNLTRAAGVMAAGRLGMARTAKTRAKLVNVPARIAYSARKIFLHLPEDWRWQQAWEKLFASAHAPQDSDESLTRGATAPQGTNVERHRQRGLQCPGSTYLKFQQRSEPSSQVG